jgi:hypothetical protein
MTSMFKRRPSASLIISCLALFIALGGTVYAGTTISGKSIKKNSLPGNRVKKKSLPANRLKNGSITGAQIKNGSITGSQINVSTLAKVPSAANADNAANAANAANASNAANAANVATVRPFSVGANNGQLVSLVQTSDFELMGFCDPNEEAFPPNIVGTEPERKGSVFVIYNRSSAPAFSENSDTSDYDFGLNKGVAFNYQDNGDSGIAVSTDGGHFISLPPDANLIADTSYVNTPETGDDYPFSTDCHFAGTALVG